MKTPLFKTFYDKITLLHQTTLEGLDETDEIKVIQAFTDLGITILEASFGFVWLNSYASSDFVLVYKSPTTPYTPQVPRKDGRNYRAIKDGTPHYITDVMEQPDMRRIGGYMKSLAIIPISYYGRAYGNIVLCFKKKERFSKEKKMLCAFIGNSAAQAITIRRLLKAEQERPKTEFLAEATHELRTPLAIIKGSVDLALQSKSTSQRQIIRTLKDVDYEVNHMSELVSDLALLINSGGSLRRKILAHDIKLRDILERAFKRLKGLADKKGITFHLGDVPNVFITGDELYLDKMFGNVVRNAITYGKKNGSVRIRVTLAPSREKLQAFIDVMDDGIGIAKKDVPRVFDRFYRAENARAINHEGTGLGLTIVKFIVEAHDGSVSVLSSKETKGTTFRLSLPVTYYREAKP